MEIGKYISQALKIHPAIHVDQLGVFRKIHRPSTYDKDRQVYLPPLDYIEFDSLEHNGFSLSTFVQQTDNIQKSDAESLVRNAVESIQESAEENGEVYLDTLGHLIQYGNALIFKPQDLTGFALEPIPYVSEEETEIAEEEETQNQISTADETKGLPPVEFTDSDIDEQGDAKEEIDNHHLSDNKALPIDKATNKAQEDDEGKTMPDDMPVINNEETEHTQERTENEITPDNVPFTNDEEKEATGHSNDENVFESPAAEDTISETEPAGIFNAEESVQEKIETKNAAHLQDPFSESNLSSQDAEEDQQNDIAEKRATNNTVWYLIAVLLILGIIVTLWYYNQSATNENEITQSDENLTERPMTIPVDTANLNERADELSPVDSTDSLRQIVSTEEISTQQVPEVALPAHHRWYIVIGAHRSLSQAEDEVENYRKKGYPRVRMLPKNPSDTFIRVIWDSYVTKQEADSALRYVHQNHVSDAWHRERKNFN